MTVTVFSQYSALFCMNGKRSADFVNEVLSLLYVNGKKVSGFYEWSAMLCINGKRSVDFMNEVLCSTWTAKRSVDFMNEVLCSTWTAKGQWILWMKCFDLQNLQNVSGFDKRSALLSSKGHKVRGCVTRVLTSAETAARPCMDYMNEVRYYAGTIKSQWIIWWITSLSRNNTDQLGLWVKRFESALHIHSRKT